MNLSDIKIKKSFCKSPVKKVLAQLFTRLIIFVYLRRIINRLSNYMKFMLQFEYKTKRWCINEKFNFISLCLFLNLYAESIFTTHPIPKKFNSFTGNIPYIQAKDFKKINQQIQQQLLQDEGVPIDFESDKIYQDHDYLSIRVNQEISGGHTYYRSRYFVINLKNKSSWHKIKLLKNISFQQ